MRYYCLPLLPLLLALACVDGAPAGDKGGSPYPAQPDTAAPSDCHEYSLESFIVDYYEQGCGIKQICDIPELDVQECAESAAGAWLAKEECVSWNTEGMSCDWWACIESWRSVLDALRMDPEACGTLEMHPGEAYGMPLECADYVDYIRECSAVDCHG